MSSGRPMAGSAVTTIATGAVGPVLGRGLVAGVGVDGVLVGGAPLGGGERRGRSVGVGRHGAQTVPERPRWQGRETARRARRDAWARTSAGWRRAIARRYSAGGSPDDAAAGLASTSEATSGSTGCSTSSPSPRGRCRSSPCSTRRRGASSSLLEAEVCSLYLRRGRQERARHARQRRASRTPPSGRCACAWARASPARRSSTCGPSRPRRPSSTPPTSTSRASARSASRSFLAVPIRGKAGPLGAVVVQRSASPLHRRRHRAPRHDRAASSPRASATPSWSTRRASDARGATGGGTRKVTLAGRPVDGRARARRGRRAAPSARRPTERARGQSASRATTSADVRLLRGAFDVAEKAIRGLRERATSDRARGRCPVPDDLRRDPRRHALPGASDRARGERGRRGRRRSRRVAREVTRTAASVTRDPFLEERARDIEDLCDALTMLAGSDRRSALPSKAHPRSATPSPSSISSSARARSPRASR